MDGEPRHKHFGDTLSDYIRQVTHELPLDGVGLWQIVPGGRYGFDLEGDALTDYVRRCLANLLDYCAVPVVGGGRDDADGVCWIAQPQYGSKSEDIVENVLQEWLSNGARDEYPGGLWFALPDVYWLPSEYSEVAGTPLGVLSLNTRLVTSSEFQHILESSCIDIQEVPTPPTYRGLWFRQPEGSIFGLRVRAQNLKTIDVIRTNHPVIRNGHKIHEGMVEPARH